ncbi:Ada metal-binding domain-containing protein [Kitasatospora sp. NPDC059577]|uniref:Ada metal-binding domain-containing protein n=1 Tax=Kitasatospora sp. NPDC059577 TaxID=3346873 RepID=UPI0036BB8F45
MRGTLGGHRRNRLYGRLDCPSARRAVARGHDVAHRVFFADEPAAIAAGYRPCAVCLPEEYTRWTSRRNVPTTPRPRTPKPNSPPSSAC